MAKPPAHAAPKSTAVVGHGAEALPRAVAEMREAILEAVRSGRIEDLRIAIELNELGPELGAAPGSDPIAHLKSLSADGEGRDILAVLGDLLESGYAVIPAGPDIENNRVYVWPYFAEIPLGALSPAQKVELHRLVPPNEVRAMRAAGKWSWWRLAISATGTWLSFGR
ncbi:MAG TPA: hypothetical protein VNK52_02780 [Hyphomicrobiaceae bacterium]|nr:hypothetical protein [Hyphomicrobiaceae bacterium]